MVMIMIFRKWTLFRHFFMLYKTRVKVGHLPHKTKTRLLFLTNSYTSRHCVPCKQHPFNVTKFLCLMLVMDTNSFKKSSIPLWDFWVNNFTTNSIPSNKTPYKNTWKNVKFNYLSKLKDKLKGKMINLKMKMYVIQRLVNIEGEYTYLRLANIEG